MRKPTTSLRAALRSLRFGRNSRRRRSSAPSWRRRRAAFEPLEDRRLLTITVNTLVDESDGSVIDGDVSLRDAIAAAAAGETINFDASLNGATFQLTMGELHIARSLTIDATSLPNGVTIDASGNDPTPAVNNGDGSRVFRISDDAATDLTVELRGLKITGGDVTGSGGGIQNLERLTLEAVTIQGNSARGGQGAGGGVWSQSATALTIRNSIVSGNIAQLAGGGVWARVADGDALAIVASTISGNAAGTAGGGVYSYVSNLGSALVQDTTISGNTAGSDGGGVYARTTAGGATTILQSTLSGNSANWRGGGVWANSVGATATTTIVHSTITLNKADADANNPTVETGGGIFANGTGSVKLENSIVAANINPGNVAPDLRNANSALTANYNLIGTNPGSGLAAAPVSAPDANGNIIGGPAAAAINPGLAPLAPNGGPTLTHALLVTSPALNRGNPSLIAGAGSAPANDQRGAPFGRVVTNPGTPARIDIGAFELSDPTPAVLQVDTLADEADGDVSAGRFSLREAIVVASSYGAHTTIVFAPALSGQSINLTLGELVITRAVTIDGSASAANVTIDAHGLSRVFRVASEAGAGASTFRRLTIAGGKTPDATSATAGGAIRVEDGGLTIMECAIRNNIGAGVATAVGLTIVNSTITFCTGPGIHQYSAGGSGLEVTVCSISGGTSDGIRLVGVPLTLTRSTVSGNSVIGISASAYASVTVNQSTIANNNYGGIVLTRSNATLTDSTVRDNRRAFGGGGISAVDRFSSITITNCTLSGNSGGSFGGGAIRTLGALTVLNSTISNNSSGAIFVTHDASIPGPTIRFSTIVRNRGGGAGGLVVSSQSSPASIQNSIISGNTAGTNGDEQDLSGPARLWYSILGRENINDNSSTPINEGGSIIGTDQNPVDPNLGPLIDNGGPTLTHAPLAGSIAINAGDPAATPGSGATPLYDQRGVGFTRVVGGRVDIGAVEVSAGNTDPQITSPSSVSVPENTTTVLTVIATDADAPPQTITFSIVGGEDAARFNLSIGGALSFKVAPDYELPQDANLNNVYLVTVKADDGHGGEDTQELAVSVTPLNDNVPLMAPSITVNVAENTTPVLPVTATDADLPEQTLYFSIVGGEDAARFAISLSGSLFFLDPPDFEAPADANGDNVYVVVVQASDGAGGTATQTISVKVNSTTPIGADFNGDGDVDGDDLPVWRGAYGTSNGPNPTPGDADGDRDADGFDFLAWQRTLGQTVPPVAASAVLPPGKATGPADVVSRLSFGPNVVLTKLTDEQTQDSRSSVALPLRLRSQRQQEHLADRAIRQHDRTAVFSEFDDDSPSLDAGQEPESIDEDYDAVFADRAFLAARLREDGDFLARQW